MTKKSKSEPCMCYIERLVKPAKHIMHVMHVTLNDKELHCNIVADSTLNWTNRCETKCQWRVTISLQGMKLSSHQWRDGATCMLHLILDAVTLFWLPQVKSSNNKTTRNHKTTCAQLTLHWRKAVWSCSQMALSAMSEWGLKTADWIANAAIYSSGLITGGTKQSANSASHLELRIRSCTSFWIYFFGSGFTFCCTGHS